MIAVVKLLVGDDPCYAALHDNGQWTSNTPDVTSLLNLVYAPDPTTAGPAAGAFGEVEVNRVVKNYRGRVLWRKTSENNIDRIY